MIAKILAYELKKSIWNPLSILLLIIMAFQGIWYTKGSYEMYQSAGVYANSAASYYQNLAGGGMLLVIIVAMFTTLSIYKDHQSGTSHWIFTYPISDKHFFVGRFLAAYFYNAFLGLGYLVGLLLTPYVGIAPEAAFGEAPLFQIFHGYFTLLLPNLFLMTALVFTIVTFLKTAASGYASILILVVFFLVMISASEVEANPFHLLADPFGYVPLRHHISYLEDAVKNTMVMSFEGYLLWNKILWFGIGVILFIIGYQKFSFRSFYYKKRKKKKEITTNNDISLPIKRKIDTVTLDFSLLANLKKVFRLSWYGYLNIVRPPSFKIVLGILLLMILLQNLIFNASYYIGAQHAITSNYTLGRLTFGVFVFILLMVWSGEWFFRAKVKRIDAILDVTPLPVWVQKISQLLSCVMLAFTLPLFFIAIGLVTQTFQGGFDTIDIGLYCQDLLSFQWGFLNYILWICFTFFIACFTNSRLVTHIVSICFFMITLLSFEFNLLEELRYGYGFTPGVEDFSNINGYGIFTESALWYFLMWMCLAVFFIFAGIFFFNRGTHKKMSQKISFKNTQLSIGGKMGGLMFLGLFFVLQNFIYRQVTVSKNFTHSAIEEADKASYEKKYAWLATKNQPKYIFIKGQFDYYPQDRRVNFESFCSFVNIGDNAIDTLYLRFPDFVDIEIKQKGTNLRKNTLDETHSVVSYLLNHPLQKEDTLHLYIKGQKVYKGLTQDVPSGDIVYDGSFGSLWNFLPTIGYDYENRNLNNRIRKENALLPLVSKIPLIANRGNDLNIAFRTDALALSTDITVTTNELQTPFASGEILAHYTKNNRNISQFIGHTENPFDIYIGSCKYVKAKCIIKGVTTTIYYDEKHTYNIDYFQEIIDKSLSFFEKYLGKYPHKMLNIYEIPFYAGAYFSFNSGIALSEKEGWLADFENKKEEQAYVNLLLATKYF